MIAFTFLFSFLRTASTLQAGTLKEASRTITALLIQRYQSEVNVATYVLFFGGIAIALAIAIWGIWNLR